MIGSKKSWEIFCENIKIRCQKRFSKSPKLVLEKML